VDVINVGVLLREGGVLVDPPAVGDHRREAALVAGIDRSRDGELRRRLGNQSGS